MSQPLREVGRERFRLRDWEPALAAFAEAVRRQASDHRSRIFAAQCLAEMGERERAISVLHVAAEGLLARDYLLSSIAACKLGLRINSSEKRLRDTLLRIHARTSASATGRAAVPPPLPPDTFNEGVSGVPLTELRGEELASKAMEVLAAPDSGAKADPNARPPLPLFSDLTAEAFVDLVYRMSFIEVPAGKNIVKEGDPGNSIFVLVAGKAKVSRGEGDKQKVLAYLPGGALFGEIAVLTGAPRSATISADQESELFEVSRDDINAIAKAHPSVPRAIAEFAQRRLAMNLLATAPLFTNLPSEQRAQVLRRFTPRVAHANERVIAEGQAASGLFLVLTGEFVVTRTDPNTKSAVQLAMLHDGDVFGEISTVTGNPATANVMATRKSAVAHLARSAFDELVQSYPAIEDFLLNLSRERLAMISEALQPAEVLDAEDSVVSG
jgi:CRP-like cAMP-binding protein